MNFWYKYLLNVASGITVGIIVAGITGYFTFKNRVGITKFIREVLIIGSVTMTRGNLDPGSSAIKKVDEKAYTFSSVKVIAGSAENIYLKSIRWHQTGSILPIDLANINTVVNGIAYLVIVSEDNKYYTSYFPDNDGKGILIDKGFSKEISIKGNIVGGSGRTAIFNIAKRADIFLFGETYGYIIIPPQSGTSISNANTAAFSSSENPWYDAACVTIE